MTRKFYRKDTALRKRVRSQPCLICPAGRQRTPTDPCHIRTFGASGVDAEWNFMPLCREHHDEQHRIGWYRFTKKYLAAGAVFTAKGWVLLEVNGQYKLFNEIHESKEGNR